MGKKDRSMTRRGAALVALEQRRETTLSITMRSHQERRCSILMSNKMLLPFLLSPRISLVSCFFFINKGRSPTSRARILPIVASLYTKTLTTTTSTTTTTNNSMASNNNNHDDDSSFTNKNNKVPTQGKQLQDFYGSETATMYANMMEDEMIKYHDDFKFIFTTLHDAFVSSPTVPNQEPVEIQVLDTCFGSGHMLKYIGDTLFKEDDKKKYKNSSSLSCIKLKGYDLSPDMMKIAKSIVIPTTEPLNDDNGTTTTTTTTTTTVVLQVGNMLDMKNLEPNDEQYHLVLNNFAMHHATVQQVQDAIQEYARILVPKGCLYFSAWEGTGKIDYGDMDFDANLHSETSMIQWITEKAGLTILNCRSFVEEEMGNMNSIYIVAQKPG